MSKLNTGQNVGYTKSKNDSIPENYPNTIVEAVYWDEKKKPLNEVLAEAENNIEELTDKKLNTPVTAGSAGQVLALDANGKSVWVDAATGGTYDGALSNSSTNAPQNKVVTAELTALGHKVDKIKTITPTTQTGYYIDDSGVKQALSATNIQKFQVEKGKYYKVSGSYNRGGVAVCVGALYENNGDEDLIQVIKVMPRSSPSVWEKYNYIFQAISDGLLEVTTIKNQPISEPLVEEFEVDTDFVKETKSAASYTTAVGYWGVSYNTVSLVSASGFKYTTPIHLNPGERVVLQISDPTRISSSMGAMVLVDSSNNPLGLLVKGDGASSVYSWTTDSEIYVSLCWASNPEVSITIYSSTLMTEVVELQKRTDFHNKSWYCFGTSISKSANEGKYPKYLAQLAGLTEHNYAVSGGSIGPHGSSGSNAILNAIKNNTTLNRADLITIEGFVNDWYSSVPLGQVTDTLGSVSFMGALNEALTFIQANSNAQIIVFTDNTGRNYNGMNIQRNAVNLNGLTQSDYIEATIKVCKYRGVPVIDVGRECMISEDTASLYLADQIHHTELGGLQYARCIWSIMKNETLRVLVM